jgi:hypothetical protein
VSSSRAYTTLRRRTVSNTSVSTSIDMGPTVYKLPIPARYCVSTCSRVAIPCPSVQGSNARKDQIAVAPGRGTRCKLLLPQMLDAREFMSVTPEAAGSSPAVHPTSFAPLALVGVDVLGAQRDFVGGRTIDLVGRTMRSPISIASPCSSTRSLNLLANRRRRNHRQSASPLTRFETRSSLATREEHRQIVMHGRG